MKWNPINSVDDAPQADGWYLVTSDFGGYRYVEPIKWANGKWDLVLESTSGVFTHPPSKLIAWAELPEPYQDPRVVQLDIGDVIHKQKGNL